MTEETIIRNRYSDIVGAEVRFTTKRKLDREEEQMLESEVFDMIQRVGHYIYARDEKRRQETYDLEEIKKRLREDEARLSRLQR